ncbi:MAG: hypothetical protein LBK95_02775, partial [Bifidobacteriaceae bacterium]|nr:hypothetical protein [Bifidobacteriaceae bacterium]
MNGWIKGLVWAAVPAVMVALAVTRPGYQVEAVELTDSSVWVTNLADGQRKVARYNAPIEELTGGFTITREDGDFDVAQAGSDVAILEAAHFRVVEPAALKLGEPTSRPGSDSASVAVGGGAALVVGANEAWLRPFEGLASLDIAAEKPDLTIGGSRVVMVPDGTVFGVGPDGAIVKARLESGQVSQTGLGRIELPEGHLDAVTAIGEAVYALAGGTLAWEGGSVDLSRYGSALELQAPVAGSGAGTGPGTVAVAAPGALLLVNGKGQITELATGNTGSPAKPVGIGDCVHAAWAAPPEGGDNYLAVCGGEEAARRSLKAVSDASCLVFRVNRQVVVLNDVQDGRVWMPTRDDQVRDALNWDQIDPKASAEANQDNSSSEDQAIDCDDKTAKPEAHDDEYGARPGASVVLTVLGNDSATSCGALSIERIDGLDPSQGAAEIVLAGRAVQFTPAGRAASANFTYTLSDANGQTDSATVAVTVSGSANQAPVGPDQPSRLAAELGAPATYQALGDFTDPDGDPMRLTAATTADPALRLSFRPDGAVTVQGDGGSPRDAAVVLTVADSLGAATQATMTVDLREPGTLVPAVDPVKADGLVGQAISVGLRDSLRTAHLSPPVFALDGRPDPTTEAHIRDGTLTFRASAANTYLVPVTVSSGSNSAKASVRIDVKEAGAPRLVAVQDTVYVRHGRPAVIDPLVNDVAEGGEVPVLAGFELAPDAGLQVVPVGHQYLEISDQGGADPTSIAYTVSAGGASARGLIRVVRADVGANQDPVVSPLTLKVRAGGVVTIPVLEQAIDPDGDELTVSTTTPIVPGPDCGTVYASGRSVRFQAPESPCPKPVSIAVPVLDGAGGSALGSFTVEVHQSAGGSKAPPEPADLTARVAQGEEVKIAVPLTGIDLDGDGVSLQQGLDAQPRFGTVTEIGPDYIKYKAGPDQQPGTDTFTYAVEDWAANRATASVSVGVSARDPAQSGVVARDDRAAARPGKVLEIPVLANDIDLSGQAGPRFCEDQELGLSSPALAAQADRDRGRLIVTLPDEPGQYQVVYHACGASGGRDSAAVNLTADPSARVSPPRAKDIVSPPQETIDKASVDIDVARWAYNPSGPSGDLELFLPPASEAHATLKSRTEVTVHLQEELPTIVFYGLRNNAADAEGATAYGSITVPPISRPPYLRPDPEPVKAMAGQEVVIVLDEFVAVARGRDGAHLLDPATPGNLVAAHGTVEAVEGGRAISYRADRDHAGPDRIEFWASDTGDASDPAAKRSRLWVDVVVESAGQHLLTFADPAPQVERGGGARTVDLAQFVHVDGAGPADPAKLTVQLGQSAAPGLSVRQSGASVTIDLISRPGCDMAGRPCRRRPGVRRGAWRRAPRRGRVASWS